MDVPPLHPTVYNRKPPEFEFELVSMSHVRRLLPHFIQAGLESPSRCAIIISELPVPNQTSLQILLETLYRCAHARLSI